MTLLLAIPCPNPIEYFQYVRLCLILKVPTTVLHVLKGKCHTHKLPYKKQSTSEPADKYFGALLHGSLNRPDGNSEHHLKDGEMNIARLGFNVFPFYLHYISLTNK